MLLSECVEYISRLYVPEGFEIDLLTVNDAKSMTSGYNEAMKASDARYKVYLHQDVFIINRNLIKDILSIFNSDKSIGLIGMVGYKTINKDAVMWFEERFGCTQAISTGAYKDISFENYEYHLEEGYEQVFLSDGLMLITSEDIPWDEELCDGWDFYDAVQCMGFIEAGKKVVVPNQRIPWFVHDDGVYLSLRNYNKYRLRFMEKYKKYLGMNIKDLEGK